MPFLVLNFSSDKSSEKAFSQSDGWERFQNLDLSDVAALLLYVSLWYSSLQSLSKLYDPSRGLVGHVWQATEIFLHYFSICYNSHSTADGPPNRTSISRIIYPSLIKNTTPDTLTLCLLWNKNLFWMWNTLWTLGNSAATSCCAYSRVGRRKRPAGSAGASVHFHLLSHSRYLHISWPNLTWDPAVS